MVLLDEPSSNLDRQAEAELRQVLAEIGKKRSVIIVTHSPILLSACDTLIALEKGRIALAGPAKKLIPRILGTAPKPVAAKPAEARRPTQPAPGTPPEAAQGGSSS